MTGDVVATTGAAESNAGDRFHILWACRRCLEMVHPKATLVGVVIEGVAEEDVSGVDDDLFLAADLTEYYGGALPRDRMSLGTSARVVVSQLKYSTRHPTKDWTASRLCKKEGKERPHSIVSRLSDTFLGFMAKNDREDVIERLTICLVSNQPASENLLQAVNSSKAYLSTRNLSKTVQTKDVISALTLKAEQEEIKKLQLASGLKSAQFCDFLRVLSLEQCGAHDRFQQYFRLRSELGAFIDGEVDQYLLKLYEQVENQALPRSTPLPLTRDDILVSLGVKHEEDLFPAPPSISNPEFFVQTSNPSELAALIEKGSSKRIVVHGVAGVGKTTVIQQLGRYLPENSELFIYDCYGQGSYRKSREERHSDRRALMQIANEMATCAGSTFMIWPRDNIPDLRRNFNRRVQQAARLVSQRNGLLVIVIDAADNSVFAARENNEGCFVPGMWEVDLPDNARLVMTARTGYRADSLNYPKDTLFFEVGEFTPANTAEHLKFFVPSVTEEECQQFHERTLSNPRLQRYLIESITGGVPIAQVLAGPRQNLEDLFEDRWEAAIHALSPSPEENLAFLSCLAAPIEFNVLEAVWGLNKQQVVRVCEALKPGAKTDDDQLGYRDEDFETFIHGKLSKESRSAAHAQIARCLEKIASTSPYAASQLARHYQKAQCYEELIDLALNRLTPDGVEDEVLRLNIIRDRLRRSLEVAHKTDKRGDVVRLLLLSGEVARAESAVFDLIRKKPELAISFGDPITVAKTYLDDDTDNNYGLAQFRCAAMLSRHSDTHDRARSHARLGNAWLQQWIRHPKEHRRHQGGVSSELIAADAEAAFRLLGADVAYQRLSGWQPFSVVLHSSWILAKAIASEISQDLQKQFWDEHRFHPLAAGVFLVELWRANNQPSADLTQEVAFAIQQYLRVHGLKHLPLHNYATSEGIYSNALTVDLCEALASIKIDRDLIKDLALRLQRPMPEHAPDRHFGMEKLENPLRCRALIAAISGEKLVVESLLPSRLSGKDDELDYEKRQERDRYISAINRLLPVIEWRCRCLLETPDIHKTKEDFDLLLTEYRGPGYGEKPDLHFKVWALLGLQGVLFCTNAEQQLVLGLAEAVSCRVEGAAPGVWKSFADHLVSDPRYEATGLILLEQAAAALIEKPNPASERCDFLSDCAEVAARRNSDLAQGFFQMAVESAQGLDNNYVQLVHFQLNLAKHAAESMEKEIKREIAVRLSRVTLSLDPFTCQPDPPLPAEETVEVVSLLHPETGASTLLKWDAIGFLALNEGVSPFLKGAMDVGVISPKQALALGRLLADSSSIDEHFIAILEHVQRSGGDKSRETFRQLLPVISQWIRRDSPLSIRSTLANAILDWLEKNHIDDIQGIAELREVLEFTKKIEAAKKFAERKANHRQNVEAQEKEMGIEEILADVPKPIFKNLEAAFAAINNHKGIDKPWAELFEIARKDLFGSQRAEYLSLLVSLRFPRWDISPLISEFTKCLEDWRNDRWVKNWRKNGMHQFLERHVQSLLGYPYQRTKNLDKIRPYLPIGDELWNAIINAIVANLPALGMWQTFILANELVILLPGPDQLSVLQWSLQRSEQELAKENGLPTLSLVDDCVHADIATQLVWALLGHPDKRERWRTMHAIRMLEGDLQEPVLSSLIEYDTSHKTPTFFPGSDFFWMSAREFLFAVIERMSHETPAVLKNHLGYLKATALSSDFPHALIRHMAGSAALAVIESLGLNDPETTTLQAVLKPSVKLPSNEERWEVGRGSTWDEERKNRRIRFDSTDTLPYWFQPLASVFGLLTGDICTRAEKWICDRWGRSQADLEWRNEEGNRKISYHLSSNDHGSLPTFETRQMYFTFHSWMLVAGELVDEYKTSDLPNRESDQCEWQSWFHYKHLKSPYWRSDMRQETPLEPILWGALPLKDEWLKIDSTDFDELMTPRQFVSGKWMLIDASVTIKHPNMSGESTVNCALVNKDKSQALMRALQVVKNPFRYGLPNEGGSDRLDIVTEDFKLYGFLLKQYDESSFEDDDTLRRQLSHRVIRPGIRLMQYFQLEPDALCQRYFSRAKEGELLTNLEIWSDNLNQERVYSMFSEGHRFWIKLDALFEILESLDSSLIVEAKITREEERRDDRYSEKVDPGKTRVYLIHSNGTIETIGGCHSLGKED